MASISVAKGRYINLSPRKGKLVADTIRDRDAGEALSILKFSQKRKGAEIVLKVLNSAIANAQVKHPNIDVDKLFISGIFFDKASYQKRFRARARGRASRILKKYSHLTIQLSERED